MISRMVRWAAALALIVLGVWSISAAPARSLGGAFASGANALPSDAVAVYSQPPSPGGGILLSSLRDPDGSSSDQWAWDDFTFAWPQTVTEIHWRGAYDPARLGSGGPVVGFTVSFYASTAANTQPDITQPPLARYEVGGNAGETAAEVLGSAQTYAYQFALPDPFQAAAGTKYWLQIQAFQSGPPDWGISSGADGNGSYFRRIQLQGPTYQVASGDAAFTLLAPTAAPFASLRGQVTLQGRPPAPDPAWALPVTVTVAGVGAFQTTTDPYGRFTVVVPAPRTCDIQVKGSTTLRNVKNSVVVSTGTVNVDFGALLAGDCNGDNMVDVEDFSILRAQFGTANPQSDLNGDTWVDIVDFSLFRTNFGRAGNILVAEEK